MKEDRTYGIGRPQHASRATRTSLLTFADTKLLHMTNQHSPIYDSQIAAFYFFQEPTADLQRRINGLVDFHGFLAQDMAKP